MQLRHFTFLFTCLWAVVLQAQVSVISSENGWVREMPPGAQTAAAYMTLVNVSDADVSIISVISNISKLTEIHEVTMDNDLMKMRKIQDLTIPAGQSIELKSGSFHIMLMGIENSLTEGDEIEFEFHLRDQPSYKMNLPVKKPS